MFVMNPSSIYDLIGLLCFLPAKRIQQELCRVNCCWDDRIPNGLTESWREWLKVLEKFNNPSIPRCLKPPKYGKLQILQLTYNDVYNSGHSKSFVKFFDSLIYLGFDVMCIEKYL